MRREYGLTLVELVVVVVAAVLLILVALPWLHTRPGPPGRAACRANLYGIGTALAIYYKNNRLQYPMIHADSPPSSFKDPMTAPNNDVYKLSRNQLEQLNFLASKRYFEYDIFICPSSGNKPLERGKGVGKYGFYDAANKKAAIDYAMHISYPSVGDDKNAAPFTDQLGGSVAILADMPGEIYTADFGKPDAAGKVNYAEGYSHGRYINVLTATLSVKSSETILSGYYENNIYTRDLPAASVDDPDPDPDGGTTVAPAVHRFDSVLYYGTGG